MNVTTIVNLNLYYDRDVFMNKMGKGKSIIESLTASRMQKLNNVQK